MRKRAALAAGLACLFGFSGWLLQPGAALPSYRSVHDGYVSSDAVLLDRNGEQLQTLRINPAVRRLQWTTLDQMSPALLDSVLYMEDRRFYSHHGVDWRAVLSASAGNMTATSTRGASTLSMQLAGMLDPSLKPAARHRSAMQKWRQMRAALRLEHEWSKQEILEAYLNLTHFRGELQGVSAASQALFGKQPSGLDRRESALLASLLPAPGAEPARVAERACLLLEGPGHECPELLKLAQSHLDQRAVVDQEGTASILARRLLKPGVARVSTTLDADLQRHAVTALRYQLSLLDKRNVSDGAVLVVDNATGEVLAYVGNSGENASARFVDGVNAPRQAGSTLKPFLYESAFERRLMTAASLLNDAPVNIPTPGGLYVPQNYDRDFKGLVTARSSLASSLNVPAVRTLMSVGVDPFVDRLRELGFADVTHDGDYYGYALALGAPEVRLWQLVNAYRTLANGGMAGDLTLVQGVAVPGRRVMDPAAVYIISDILSDRSARSLSFGLENPLATRFWTAVKTGTSKDMRDNWCIGYSSRYTVGVWIGNFSGSSMWDVSGVSGAAPLWLDIMNYLHRSEASAAPVRPPGLVTRRVAFIRSREPARQELFMADSAVGLVAPAAPSGGQAHIAYPSEGMVIALDPDIPAPYQRVRFSADAGSARLSWRLDGHALGTSDVPVIWSPQTGRHRLALADAAGREADHVEFEVRGGD